LGRENRIAQKKDKNKFGSLELKSYLTGIRIEMTRRNRKIKNNQSEDYL
jgi:hypothetical protein